MEEELQRDIHSRLFTCVRQHGDTAEDELAPLQPERSENRINS